MHLTKSLFLHYLDSPLHLWLAGRTEHQPRPLSLHDQHLQRQGYQVEVLAKEFVRARVAAQYPAGTTLSFEATLTDGPYQSRIDALVHDVSNDCYDLYEIKSSTSVQRHHKDDVTFQYLVGRASLPLRTVYLVHVNGDYQRAGAIDHNELFVVADMTEQIATRVTEVEQQRAAAWRILQLPQAPSEEHCFNPNTCLYPEHCFPALPAGSIYELSRASKQQYQDLLARDITLLRDIPATFPVNPKQRRQIQSAQQGQPLIDRAAIARELAQLRFPLYFLDYETYGEALPMYDGYKPYQQAVTQFSLHVARQPDSEQLKHYEYLATAPGDPARALATALCHVIGDTGAVIVWNKSFECGRNDELAVLCPDLASQLRSINERAYDLMEIFSKGLYVDHRFQGSASIKKVLPVLCPQLSYQDLAIGEGTKAMLAWHEMVHGDLDAVERAQLKQDLLDYCKLDTWAMVEIWRRVREEA